MSYSSLLNLFNSKFLRVVVELKVDRLFNRVLLFLFPIVPPLLPIVPLLRFFSLLIWDSALMGCILKPHRRRTKKVCWRGGRLYPNNKPRLYETYLYFVLGSSRAVLQNLLLLLFGLTVCINPPLLSLLRDCS